MGSQLNSNNADLVFNATGTDNDLVFQQNGVEKGRVGAGGFGKVLQVVQVIEDDLVSVVANTWAEFMSASITPVSTSSKILVTVSMSLNVNGNNDGYGVLKRDGVDLAKGIGAGDIKGTFFFASPNGYGGNTVSYAYLDSPNKDTTTTYSVEAFGQGTEVYLNRRANTTGSDSGTATSTITVMEIGA